MDGTPALMQGFPPPPEAQVTLANWRAAPFNRWSFQHVRELLPTAEIANDPARTIPLETALRDLGGLSFAADGRRLGCDDFMDKAEVDGLVVLHGGRLIHESYRNDMTAETPHILMSVSKSMLGLLAGTLVEHGRLDPEAPATDYVPELETTAYRGATVRHLLDMRTGVHFPEDYSETEELYVEYRKATGWTPHEPGEEPSDLRSFYQRMTMLDGPHGGPFRYISPCTDLLGWVVERATGIRYADLMSELLWKPLGAERPASITVDRLGAPRPAGGMCMTTRDLARIGQLFVENGRGIVPSDWIDDIASNGDADAWAAGDFAGDYPGMPMHYRSKWYVLREPGPILMALGIHGQNLMVDPEAQLVLARHSSVATPLDAAGERLTLALFKAIRELLR